MIPSNSWVSSNNQESFIQLHETPWSIATWTWNDSKTFRCEPFRKYSSSQGGATTKNLEGTTVRPDKNLIRKNISKKNGKKRVNFYLVSRYSMSHKATTL